MTSGVTGGGGDFPVNTYDGERRSTKCSPSQHQIDILTYKNTFPHHFNMLECAKARI